MLVTVVGYYNILHSSKPVARNFYWGGSYGQKCGPFLQNSGAFYKIVDLLHELENIFW